MVSDYDFLAFLLNALLILSIICNEFNGLAQNPTFKPGTRKHIGP
jgi:hypothetical protein